MDSIHGVAAKEPLTCLCGEGFDSHPKLVEHISVGQKLELLMGQLHALLGEELMSKVSIRVHQQGKCSNACICPALIAYTELYRAGWAIVPVEHARQLKRMAQQS